MTEEDLVERLKLQFPFSHGVGIGDDAAVCMSPPTGSSWVITTDLLVEGVHFRRQDASPELLACKCLAVNLSDLAAMGAKPLFYTLALAAPHDFAPEELWRFFNGLKEGNQRWHIELAGGDFSASSILTVSITAVGEVDCPSLRSGAQEGDLLAVCGRLGWSKLGLIDLLSGVRTGPFVEAHLQVDPLLDAGIFLNKHVSAMMDISDGLIKDLTRLCKASGVGALVNGNLLDSPEIFQTKCQHGGIDPLQTILNGGEDYALLFTASPKQMSVIQVGGIDPPPRVIGRIVSAKEGVRVEQDGRVVAVEISGFDHFQFSS